jgi:hypothetical protein
MAPRLPNVHFLFYEFFHIVRRFVARVDWRANANERGGHPPAANYSWVLPKMPVLGQKAARV